MDSLRYVPTAPASGLILAGDEPAGEVRGMSLCGFRLGPGSGGVIGCDVPVPLYWRQYANHEDPDRNAGSFASVEAAGSVTPSTQAVMTSAKPTTTIAGDTRRSGPLDSRRCRSGMARLEGRAESLARNPDAPRNPFAKSWTIPVLFRFAAIGTRSRNFHFNPLEDEVVALEAFAPAQAELAAMMEEKVGLEYAYSQARLALLRRSNGYGPPVLETAEELLATMAELRTRLVA